MLQKRLPYRIRITVGLSKYKGKDHVFFPSVAIKRGLQSQKGHSIVFWQGRGSLKGAITAFTAARVLAYIFR